MAEWRDIPGYEGYYQAGDTGHVRSLDRFVKSGRGVRLAVGQLLNPFVDNGRPHVTLNLRGHKKISEVGPLILTVFAGPAPIDGLECCHYDGDPFHNHITNLRWDTRSANTFDSVRHGTHAGAAKTYCDYGHEFSPENTAHWGGRRYCRTCHRRRKRDARRRAKSALANR